MSAGTPVAAAPVGQPAVAEGSRQVPPKAARHAVRPGLRAFARRLRTTSTDEEALLWALLRNRRFAEYKFRRQVPIGRYVADFVCHSAKLVVELDGSQHVESQHDWERDAAIARHGYRILRVWNNELAHARGSVLDAIWYALQPSPGGDPS